MTEPLPAMTEDTHYKVFKILENKPEISQRELAAELGVSLGNANYCGVEPAS